MKELIEKLELQAKYLRTRKGWAREVAPVHADSLAADFEQSAKYLDKAADDIRQHVADQPQEVVALVTEAIMKAISPCEMPTGGWIDRYEPMCRQAAKAAIAVLQQYDVVEKKP